MRYLADEGISLMAGRLKLFVNCAVVLALFVYPAISEEILASPQQSLIFGNCTLVVEDADSESGQVWLRIFVDHGPPQSAIIAIDESLHCGGAAFKVSRIYAGCAMDLAAIEILDNE